VDGDACFSYSNLSPRLKFENAINELELLKKIKEFLKAGNLNTYSPRKNRPNTKSVCVLEITNINTLKNIVVPIFTKNDTEFQVLNSKKSKDFKLWSMLLDIIFMGYHKIEEGISLINEIKLHLNKLTTGKKNLVKYEYIDFEIKMKNLLSLPSPYELKNGIRFIRGTNIFVSNNVKILCVDANNSKQTFSSITECSKNLKIDRKTIKKYLLNGEKYNNYQFIYLK
jgi:LAGLIDADG DNA endonuclease family protein/NUMOD1 domain-containing protein